MAGNAWNALHWTGKGNLSTGIEADDGAGDATHGYAKGDCWVNIPLNVVNLSGAGNAFSRTGAGVYQIAASTAATAVTFGFDALPWIFRRFSGTPAAAAPHGFKWTDLIVSWTVANTNASAASVTVTTETFTDNVARAQLTTTFGTIAYENPVGTSVASPPTTQRANPYLWRAIPGTTASPIANAVFQNTDNSRLNFEIAVTTGATNGTVTINYIGVHFALALY